MTHPSGRPVRAARKGYNGRMTIPLVGYLNPRLEAPKDVLAGGCGFVTFPGEGGVTGSWASKTRTHKV